MKIKNVSPLGELDVILLGRIVGAGEVVEVTAEQAAELLAQGIFEAADKAAEKLAPSEPAVTEPTTTEAQEG